MNYQQDLRKSNVATDNRQYNAFRTLYLMLGGTGMKVGMRLRKRIVEAYGEASLPFQEFLWLDSDRNDLRSQTIDDTREMAERLALPASDIVDLRLPFERVRHFRSHPHDHEWLFKWLRMDVVDDLGASARAEEGAAQIRTLGRLALEANFDNYHQQVRGKISRLFRPSMDQECQDHGFAVDAQSLEVVVLCSLAGGTGSGCFIEAARTLRAIAGRPVNVTAYLLMPHVFSRVVDSPRMWEDMRANAYAALSELNALSALGTKQQPIEIGEFRVDRPMGDPFNQIYLVGAENSAGMALDEPKDDDAYEMVSDALLFDFEQSDFGTLKRSHRCNVAPHLANETHLSVPVEDGTRRDADEEKPRYVFRFPNAFGAFGLARVPFDRLRLRRAGAAWLGAEMFKCLTAPPGKELNRAEVKTTIVTPAVDSARLGGKHVVDQLLLSGDGVQTYPEAQAGGLHATISAFRKQVDTHFAAPGLTERERLDALRAAEGFARQVSDDVRTAVLSAQREVGDLLSEAGPSQAHGQHVKEIVDKQDAIFSNYQTSLRDFIVDLLAKPNTHGLQVARLACDLLSEELGSLATDSAPDPKSIEVGNLAIEPGPAVRKAVELRAQADALFLPGYRQLARSYYERRNRDLINDACNTCISQARNHLDGIERDFKNWCTARYEVEARRRGAKLFARLADFIGEQTEVRDDAGHTTVKTTGLQHELRNFGEASDHAEAHFSGLLESYGSSQRSERNASALGDTRPWADELTILLAGGQIHRKTLPELLVDEWQSFFGAAGMLSQGNGGTFRQGVADLVERASDRVRDASRWEDVQRALEDWTHKRLRNSGYLNDKDAINLLGELPAQRADELLAHAGKGAAPWLVFDPRYGKPRGMQALALVGTQHVKAPALGRWAKSQADMTNAKFISSHGGSIVFYAERMAFPLFHVGSLAELEDGYRAVSRRSTFEIYRRHTVKEHLALPVLRPPAQASEAANWFAVDRLALEGLLLNVFETQRDGTVRYSYRDPQTQLRNRFEVPRTLGALAAKLRSDDKLHAAVEREVRQRTSLLLGRADHILCAIKLAQWTADEAFPKDTTRVYLEHELAASILRQWRESAEVRLSIQWNDQPALWALQPDVEQLGVRSGITAGASTTETLYAISTQLLEAADQP